MVSSSNSQINRYLSVTLFEKLFGYTFHEHYDKLGLINMNRPKGAHGNTSKINHRVAITFGRVYDPVVGRFLSVDPLVGNPLNSQDYNGYSYCGNNPLAFTDPSGYQK
ncbi:MAG TPA: RHS repeat-associated core domain-containing protein, partial [Williamwhitmania sp.]|nr:RHS repeat-associated core domain-containing protein [Williamwhitmania sp.]